MADQSSTLRVGIDSRDMERGARQGEQALNRLGNRAKKTDKELDGLSKGASALGKAFAGLVAGIGVVSVLQQATSAALGFGKGVSEISTLIDPVTFDMESLTTALREQAVTFGSLPTEQAAAGYAIVSAGASSAAEAIDILSVANQLAVGGVTDVATAADGLTSVLNAYGDKIADATAASDALFVGVRAGKTTIAELSGSLGKVAPLAARAGVSFDELVAAVSALTKGGIQTTEAVTGVRAIMASVVKPTKEASELAADLGLSFNSAALEAKGFAGFMDEVVAKTGGSSDQLAVLFGGVEALVPAMALAGQAGADFASIMEQMGQKTGATAEAFKRMSEDDAQRLAVAMADIRDVLIDLGSVILTVLVPAVEAAAAALRFVADNVDVLVIAMGVLAARAIPTAIAGIASMVTYLGTMEGLFIAGAVASRVLTLAMTAIPFVAVVTGLTLAYRWFTSTDEATTKYTEATEAATRQNVEFTGTLGQVAQGLRVTSDELAQLTVTEVLSAQAAQAGELEAAMSSVSDQILALGEAARSVEGITVTEEMTTQFYDLAVAVEKGNVPLGELRDKFDKLGAASPKLRPLIATLFESITAAETASERAERLAATMRFLNGEATDADKVLLGLVNAINATGGAMSGAAAATYSAIPPFSELREKYGDLATTARDLLVAQNALAAIDAQAGIEATVIAAGVAADKLKLATGETESFRAKLAEIKTLDTFSAQAVALSNVAAELLEATGGLQRMDAETRAVYQSLIESAQEAANLGGQIDQANSSATPLASNLQNAGSAALNAAGGAGYLANRLNVASNAAANLLSNLGRVPAALGAMAQQVDNQIAQLANQNATLTYQVTQGLSSQAASIKATRDEAIRLAIANGASLDQAAALGQAFDEQAAKAQSLATTNAKMIKSLQDAETAANGGGSAVGAMGKAAADAAKEVTAFTDTLDQEFARIQEQSGGAVAAVEAWYQEQKAKLASLGLEYTEYANKLEVIFNDKVAAAYKTDLANATDWRSGIERAVQGLSESIGNESDLAEMALTSLFDNAANAIANFAKTGKLDFKEFARSVAADILMMTTRMLLLKALKGIFGFNEGGMVGSPLQLATGGFLQGPGSGTSDSIPTMLSNGEYVINAKATGKYLPLLDAINSGKDIGFASGGLSAEGGNLGAPPKAAKSDDTAAAATGDASKSIVINNYVTSKAIGEALDTPDGEVVVMNIIERNRNTVKGLLG